MVYGVISAFGYRVVFGTNLGYCNRQDCKDKRRIGRNGPRRLHVFFNAADLENRRSQDLGYIPAQPVV
jgi:hypothetical protein